METRTNLSTILISCGTLVVIAALFLVGYQMSLSAQDIREHRLASSSLLRDSTIERVTLSEWEPPSIAIAWVALAGGFGLIGIGVRDAWRNPSQGKSSQRDDLD